MDTLTAVEYLVPSSQRRALLKLLLRQDGLSLRQLANRVQLTYSNAHREVGLLQKAGLVTAERVGNALLCRWNKANSHAQALEALFSVATDEPDEDTVFSNLKRWHAPLSRDASSRRELSLEETLSRALLLARRHPEVAIAWPVALARNLTQVNLRELEAAARRLGEKQTLGFFLSLTATLLKRESLRQAARRLHDGRMKKPRDFFLMPQGDRASRLAAENTPAPARQWRFRMNLPLRSFESFFEKFVTPDEPISKQ